MTKSDLILIGELHGTKEIPKYVFEFIKNFPQHKICLELPNRKVTDGRASLEFLKKNISEPILLDVGYVDIADREFVLAKNIRSAFEKYGKIIAILGNFHAAKIKVFGKDTVGFLLKDLNPFCISINSKGGYYYDGKTVKKYQYISTKKYYDEEIILDRITSII